MSRFKLLDERELAALPRPSWLIDGILPNGLSVLFGPPKAGKSFLALDWALSIGAGERWLGRRVRQGWVVYLAAEGADGLRIRVPAWRSHRGIAEPLEHVRYLATGANLLDPAHVAELRELLAKLPEPPRLIVVDTMARTLLGGDENSAKDVGTFIAVVDQLRQGRAALVVHHSGHDRDHRERGSSALRGAADLSARVEKDGRQLKLSCEALKDAAEWKRVDMWLTSVAGSCAIDAMPPEDPDADEDPRDRAQRRQLALESQVLDFVTARAPVSKRAVRAGVTGRAHDVDAALESLAEANRLHRTRDGYAPCPEAPDTVGTRPNGPKAGGVSPGDPPDVVGGPRDTPPAPGAENADTGPDTATNGRLPGFDPDVLDEEVLDPYELERRAAEGWR